MSSNLITDTTLATITSVGLKVVGAIVIWILGRWIIEFALKVLTRSLDRGAIEPTLTRYVRSTVGVLLNAALVVAILGFFGVETTTFAALVAACGVAIGVAWGGLLANFAAGAFLMVLRPFKAGDFVSAAGVTGSVAEIGLFVTTINTPDNVRTFVGNNKIFGETIQNFSANPYRRVDLSAQLSESIDYNDAIERLRAELQYIPNVLSAPAPDVAIIQHSAAGPVLAVRPYCANAHYWQVYFDTNRAIPEILGQAASKA